MRSVPRTKGILLTCMSLAAVVAACFFAMSQPVSAEDAKKPPTMQVYYLEIVTKEVDAVLGNARAAPMQGGGWVGVRAPMRETELPIVRPYWLVDDIKAAVAAAVKAGGSLAVGPTEIPGYGTFAIYVQGGINGKAQIDHGLWQR